MEENNIRKKLYALRKSGREEYLKLAGIDVEKVRVLEKRIDAQYSRIAEQLKKSIKESGKETVELHADSLKRTQTMLLESTRKQLETAGRVITAKDFTEHTWYKIPYCWCSYVDTAIKVPPPTEEIVLEYPPKAVGSVTYNGGTNIAHPSAEARGAGTGTINSAKVTTSFKFAFNPTTNHTYCILPLVYMIGHWLVWTWNRCGGEVEELGEGEVKVIVRVKVTQFDTKIKEIEHVVLHESASGGQDRHSGFTYDSWADDGTALKVYLQGGYTAVITVECECFAEVISHGRAWVDMQSSPSFYFKVPAVWWGWRHCSPPWLEIAGLAE